jgi:hypothetical protein
MMKIRAQLYECRCLLAYSSIHIGHLATQHSDSWMELDERCSAVRGCASYYSNYNCTRVAPAGILSLDT